MCKKNEIIFLWQTVFGDSEVYITRFISHFGIENCYVCEMDEKIVAMAFAIPTTLTDCGKDLPVKYIYACATHPDYRGREIMKKLLNDIYEDAFNEDFVGIFLHAADENLAKYYRKLGFEDFFYCARQLKLTAISAHRIPHTTYRQLRVQKLENSCFVNWNEEFFKFLAESGTRFCKYEDAIFAYRVEDNKVIVEEFLGDASDTEMGQCFGQMKWCTPKNLSSGYFAFAME